MLYDLNVPWSSTTSPADLQRTISFLSELNYTTIAINHTPNLPLPTQIINPIPLDISSPSAKTILLRRCTIRLSDPTTANRHSALSQAYDILAIRPQNEKSFLAACLTLSEHSLISLDLSINHRYYFKPKPCMTAVKRGIRFEICYAQGIGSADSGARRNFITNVLALIRATSGRGLVVSSEAKTVLGVRGSDDVRNLLVVWGMGQERAAEAVGVNPRGVVVNEGIKRSGYRGIIDVVEGSVEKYDESAKTKAKGQGQARSQKNGKRKNDTEVEEDPEMPKISKRQAKKMRLEAMRADAATPSSTSAPRPDIDTQRSPEMKSKS